MIDADWVFEVPSKTFIVGEYLALNGTASLVMATEPSFVIRTGDKELGHYHGESPAGRFQSSSGLSDKGFSLNDPHEGRGGFGRSTAEYLSVYLQNFCSSGDPEQIKNFVRAELQDFVQTYQESSGGSYRPSGADLVAQVFGGLCWYDGMNFAVDTLNWPFPGYDIFVFHTGKKLQTHSHLESLDSLNLNALIPILIATRTSLDRENLRVFADAINNYYDALNDLGLSDSDIYQRVEKLRSHPDVLAAKGCGAMGVDTVIVLAESSALANIEKLAQAEGLSFVSSLSNANTGASVRRPM